MPFASFDMDLSLSWFPVQCWCSIQYTSGENCCSFSSPFFFFPFSFWYASSLFGTVYPSFGFFSFLLLKHPTFLPLFVTLFFSIPTFVLQGWTFEMLGICATNSGLESISFFSSSYLLFYFSFPLFSLFLDELHKWPRSTVARGTKQTTFRPDGGFQVEVIQAWPGRREYDERQTTTIPWWGLRTKRDEHELLAYLNVFWFFFFWIEFPIECVALDDYSSPRSVSVEDMQAHRPRRLSLWAPQSGMTLEYRWDSADPLGEIASLYYYLVMEMFISGADKVKFTTPDTTFGIDWLSFASSFYPRTAVESMFRLEDGLYVFSRPFINSLFPSTE